MANRGTKKGSPKGPDNWEGKPFSEFANKLKEIAKDIYVSTGRGTGKIKLGDLPDSKPKKKGKYVSSGRGTKRTKQK